jgi:hypothetical protein
MDVLWVEAGVRSQTRSYPTNGWASPRHLNSQVLRHASHSLAQHAIDAQYSVCARIGDRLGSSLA